MKREMQIDISDYPSDEWTRDDLGNMLNVTLTQQNEGCRVFCEFDQVPPPALRDRMKRGGFTYSKKNSGVIGYRWMSPWPLTIDEAGKWIWGIWSCKFNPQILCEIRDASIHIADARRNPCWSPEYLIDFVSDYLNRIEYYLERKE